MWILEKNVIVNGEKIDNTLKYMAKTKINATEIHRVIRGLVNITLGKLNLSYRNHAGLYILLPKNETIL